jgi:hypothetical protein
MTAEEHRQSIKELMTIPNMQRDLADELLLLGIKKVGDLKYQSAERLYQRLNIQARKIEDRTVLYILRCAVYYASTPIHDPAKLKWKYWVDQPATKK